MATYVSFSGVPEWKWQQPGVDPALRTAAWVDVIIALGIRLAKEAERAQSPEDSEWLRGYAEKGWTYDTWLQSVELALESVFPRQRVTSHLKLRGRRFHRDHIRDAIALLLNGRDRARAFRRRMWLLSAVSWVACLLWRGVSVSWIALAYLLPLSLWLSVPILWILPPVGRVVEQFTDTMCRRYRRRTIILEPPLHSGCFGIYLRSFLGDEHVASADRLPLPLRASWSRPLWPGRSLIERLSGALAPIGPLVAFGWPEDLQLDTIPLLAMAVPDRNWQDRVLAAARDAAVIVVDQNVLVGGGHSWELEHVLQSDLLEKTIFILPYDPLPSLTETIENLARTFGLIPVEVTPYANLARIFGVPRLPSAESRYEHFRRLSARVGLQLPEYDPQARFLYFDGERIAHIVPESHLRDARPRAVALLNDAFASSRVPQTDKSLVAFHLTRKSLVALCHALTLAAAWWLQR